MLRLQAANPQEVPLEARKLLLIEPKPELPVDSSVCSSVSVISSPSPSPPSPPLPCVHCQKLGSVRSSFPRRHVYPYVSMCEVALHNDFAAGDCWIVSEDRVYDVSAYTRENEHPGGERAFVRRAGGSMDCLRDFNFHSAKAKKVWAEYQVAVLIPCSPPRENAGVDSQTENFCVLM